MNTLNILSTVVLVLIAAGIIQRKTPSRHWPLMTLAFLLDFGIVLYLELTRDAIDTTLSGPPPMLIFHIFVSGLVFILYLVQFYLGYRLLTGKLVSSSSHRIVGISFGLLRLMNYVTSFVIPLSLAAAVS
jgi:uncharacterized membrane protein YozB (DUF420 family)